MFFAKLKAHLDALRVPDMGTAAVVLGEQVLLVDYSCDGRISWHQTFDREGVWLEQAPFMSFEGHESVQESDHWILAELLNSEHWNAVSW